MKKKPTEKKRQGAPTGPKPEILKIEGDWRVAIKKSLEKNKPAEGWPK
jgi:hypothetical protein